jgi:hypothetical protein
MSVEGRHLREIMDERDVRYQQRYAAQEHAVDEALISINGRLGLLNELRAGVATREQLEAVEKEVAALRSSVEAMANQRAGGQASVKSIYAAIAAAVALISIVVVIANAVYGG